MNRPRLLDLFCCAGGAAMGYHQAGFDVVGVDIKPQPRYPFAFIQADAVKVAEDRSFVQTFSAVHASPPCQGYTALRHAPGAIGAPKLVNQIRDRLFLACGGYDDCRIPFVIENVEYCEDLWCPVMLCGSSFGLGAQGCELRRHRQFDCTIRLSVPECQHSSKPVVGVYGGHARKRAARHGGRGTRDTWIGGHKAAASEALGIDWMTLAEMSEAIPPAYTRFIGEQLLTHIRATERLAA